MVAVVQSLSRVCLFATPWTAAQTLDFPVLHHLPEFAQTHVSIESVVLSNYLILCYPLLLLPSIFPSIRVFPMSQLFTSVLELQHQSFQ